MTAINLRRDVVDGILATADNDAKDRGAQLVDELPEWSVLLQALYRPECPLTYLPVLCVALVARAASPDVNVKRIQTGDEYSAALVGQRLVEYGRENEIDVRTDSSNVMNSQPFVRQPEITADLSAKPQYPDFFASIEKVQDLAPTEAKEVLALAFHMGRENWPHRMRRKQKNLINPVPKSADAAYFILNQSPLVDFQHYDGEGYYGFHENVTSAKSLVEAGGGRFVFYRTSDAKDSPMTFVGSGVIPHVLPQPDDEDGRQVFHAVIDFFKRFSVPVAKADGAPPGWNSQNSISRITKEAFERLILLGTGQSPTVEPMSLEDLRAECDARGLIISDRVLATLLSALDSGKHVILTGPPGTAKTTLAVLVAKLAAKRGHSRGSMLTTATSDWSTYDTIGGLAPSSDGTLSFRRGRFLDALATDRWLIVDELNRSNFDRAFGQLFTVLAGEDVVLPYNDNVTSRPLRVRHQDTPEDGEHEDIVVMPGWRMIGTINNFDKSLLFEMSFALMRRFAFVEVPAPTDAQFLELAKRPVLDDGEDVARLVAAVATALLPLRGVKELGPAVFIDAARMARSLALGSELSQQEIALQVFYAMFLPQFEGIEEPEGRRLLKIMRGAVGAGLGDELRRIVREVLGLQLAGLSDADESHSPAGSNEAQ